MAFALAAAFIFVQGRKYRSLHAPAPEGVSTMEHTGTSRPSMAELKILELQVVRTSAGTPPRPSLERDPMKRTKYREAIRLKREEVGDLMLRRGRTTDSIDHKASLVQNAEPPAGFPPPVPGSPPRIAAFKSATVTPGSVSAEPVVPAPTTLFASPPAYVATHVPAILAASIVSPDSSTSPSPSAPITRPSGSSSDMESSSSAPSVSKLAIPQNTDTSLPNPWGDHTSELPLLTPAEDKPLPSPYAQSVVATLSSPARADTPDPYSGLRISSPSVSSIPPLRVQKQSSMSRVLPNPHMYNRTPSQDRQGSTSSTFDMAMNSRGSALYTLPALDFSYASLQMSMKGPRSSSTDSISKHR